jgi:hypothetical protein
MRHSWFTSVLSFAAGTPVCVCRDALDAAAELVHAKWDVLLSESNDQPFGGRVPTDDDVEMFADRFEL